MGPICPSTCSGEVRIEAADLAGGGEPTPGWLTMHCPAWNLRDAFPLWQLFPDEQRGENSIMPGAIGRRPNPKRPDEAVEFLPFDITGAVDRFGVMYGDGSDAAQLVGLETNLAFLEAHLSPPTLPAVTRAAQLIMPSTAVRTAGVQLTISLGKHLTDYVAATLNFTIPPSRFA